MRERERERKRVRETITNDEVHEHDQIFCIILNINEKKRFWQRFEIWKTMPKTQKQLNFIMKLNNESICYPFNWIEHQINESNM